MKRLFGVLAFALVGIAPTTSFAQFDLVKPFWEKSAPLRTPKPLVPSFSNIKCRDNGGELPTFTHRTGKAIVVFLCDQYLVVYVGHTLWTHGAVSTGKIGFETLPGRYVVCGDKGNAKTRSNKYPLPNGGAPMPYAVSFCKVGHPPIWTGMAIHAGELPGSRLKPFGASHGCVRTDVVTAKEINLFAFPSPEADVPPDFVEVLVVRDVQEFYDLYDKEIAVTNGRRRVAFAQPALLFMQELKIERHARVRAHQR